jgi:Tfp pilus assembly protein PilN
MSPPRQQVNLYRPDDAAGRRLFGADTLVLTSAAVMLLLLLIGGAGEWRINGLQRAVGNLQQQQQAQQETMRALGDLLPAGASSADIHSRIQELQAELDAREQALSLLRQGAIGRTGGFSAQLAALARCPVPGLWLQRITISGVTGSVSLAGDTLDPDSVPRYLRALAGERALAGLRFDQLIIARPPPPSPPRAAGPMSVARGAFTFSADGDRAAYARLAAAQEPRP